MPQWKERSQQPREGIDPQHTVDRGVAQLLEELQQGKSARLEQYLAFTSRFHRYSANNQMLIYSQLPTASLVAGYVKWRELGYQVAKGAKAIWILAPRPYKKLNEETQEEEQKIWFKTVAVFDVSQLTKDKELPTFFTPLADDQHTLYDRLTQVVSEEGIAIAEEETGLAQGYSAGGKISLKTGLDSRNRVLVLIHEFAHELLHKTDEGKAQAKTVKECHAEAVSYVVAHHFGIHNPYSSDYLQNWGNTATELTAELEIVRSAAAYIIDRLEGFGTKGGRTNQPQERMALTREE